MMVLGEVNIMRIPTSTLIIMACIAFLAIVVISGYEERAEMAEGRNPSLKQFLEDDTTSAGVYDWDYYHCVHFSVALASNMTDAGYNATPIILATSRPGEWSHMVVSVDLGNETVYIEPQTDEVFSPSRWDFNVSLGDEVVLVNISTARSMMG